MLQSPSLAGREGLAAEVCSKPVRPGCRSPHVGLCIASDLVTMAVRRNPGVPSSENRAVRGYVRARRVSWTSKMWPFVVDRLSPGGDVGDTPPRRCAAWLCSSLLLIGLGVSPLTAQEDAFRSLRHQMVETHVHQRGIQEPALLEAMEVVPRHLFVPEAERSKAYLDEPVTIAPGQTLYQAYLSARMISLLDLKRNERVLEIGTGSGYDAAVLSRMAREVFTIEIDKHLADRARALLEKLGYENVNVRVGDGYRGWKEEAPFDAILLTAAPERIPLPLLDQLKDGGRMVVAVGDFVQELQLITKSEGGLKFQSIEPVRMVPMTGEVEQRD